jgi:anti-sigma B factor antagonist
MQIGMQQVGAVMVMEPNGRIDSTTAKPFGDSLLGALKPAQSCVIVDFKNILYISSAGFRVLLLAGRMAEETQSKFALCNLTAEVSRLFDLGAFTDLFVIYPSRDEGLTEFSA